MKHSQTVADLELKNKRLSEEIDKVHTHNFELQNEITALKERLASKAHSEQLAGWAIDRALEFAKLQANKPANTAELIEFAKQICAGINEIAPQGEPTNEQ